MTQLHDIVTSWKGSYTFAYVLICLEQNGGFIMKRSYITLIMMLIISFSLLLFGCKNIRLSTYSDSDSKTKTKKTDQTLKTDENNTADQADTKEKDKGSTEQNSEDAVSATSDGPTTLDIKPEESMEMVVYTVNANFEVEATSAAVPKSSKITPQLIVDTVKEAMAERSLVIGIESVTTEGTAVIVSFYADQPPLSNVGAGYESAILDAIAQSLVENLEDYNKVIYRVEGEAYISGHIELGIDEVYLID